MRADCLSVFADCFIFLITGWRTFFFKTHAADQNMSNVFPPCMVLSGRGERKGFGRREGEKVGQKGSGGNVLGGWGE